VTSTDWFQVVLILLAIVLTGLNAAAEVALTRTNRVRALRLAEEGRRGSAAVVRVVEDPAPFLNVILFLTLLFTIGGSTIATSLAVRHLQDAGEIVAAVGMTLLLFVFAR